MKKVLVVLAVAVVIALVAAGAAMAGITNSKHDLRSASTATIKADGTYNEICAVCHTPHNAISGSAPLWNRLVGTETITYNAQTTARGTSWVPGAASKACLSCHDGTIGFGVATLANPGFDGQPVFTTADTLMPGSSSAIGQTADSLSNDHPVGVVIPASGFDTVANIETAGLTLYGGTNTVECGTCHDAHDYGTAVAGTLPFLAISNLASGMCLECHLK